MIIKEEVLFWVMKVPDTHYITIFFNIYFTAIDT